MIYVITAIVLIASVRGNLWEGDYCDTDGQRGKCVRFGDCEHAVYLVHQGLTPKLCVFNSSEPIICCPNALKRFKRFNPLMHRKSKMKCVEYSLLFPKKKTKRVHPRKADFGVDIVGGVDVNDGEFPHMAALGYGPDGEISWKCGGTLISKRFVLTAAHCLSSVAGNVRYVRLGDNQLDGASGTYQDHEVLRGVLHPDYHPPSLYNDIALLELKSPVTFSKTIKPACLHQKDSAPETLLALGWGLTQFGGAPSNALQEVDLQLFSHEECQRTYGTSSKKVPEGIKNEFQICAGGRNAEKDTCQGDSGGPLQARVIHELYKVVGVTSFGKACGTTNVPGVYTRVSSYVDWIESVVWS